jgi:hypothetical protein
MGQESWIFASIELAYLAIFQMVNKGGGMSVTAHSQRPLTIPDRAISVNHKTVGKPVNIGLFVAGEPKILGLMKIKSGLQGGLA